MSKKMCYLDVTGDIFSVKDLRNRKKRSMLHHLHTEFIICSYKKISEKNKACLVDHGGWMGVLPYIIQLENPEQKEKKKKQQF